MASALNSVDGYELTDDFRNAIKLLTSSYSVADYAQFLDDWGSVGHYSNHTNQLHTRDTCTHTVNKGYKLEVLYVVE